ncbi:hypothetical protein SDC9_189630 [bioreactor metagenome]|uniref:Uncharacterized protein n=1 Tax=bioreactor metagenome TaxID=1076179 RepID=A0A645I0W4_9ZZZZ
MPGVRHIMSVDLQTHINLRLLRGLPDVHYRRLKHFLKRERGDVLQVIQRVETGKRQQLVDQTRGTIDARMELHQRFLACLRIIIRKLRHLRLDF